MFNNYMQELLETVGGSCCLRHYLNLLLHLLLEIRSQPITRVSFNPPKPWLISCLETTDPSHLRLHDLPLAARYTYDLLQIQREMRQAKLYC